MGSSKDKEGLEEEPLTLPTLPPGPRLPGSRDFSWLHLAARTGGWGPGQPCNSLKVTWAGSILFSFSEAGGSPLSQPCPCPGPSVSTWGALGLSQTAFPSTLVPLLGWYGAPGTQFTPCSSTLQVQPPIPQARQELQTGPGPGPEHGWVPDLPWRGSQSDGRDRQ